MLKVLLLKKISITQLQSVLTVAIMLFKLKSDLGSSTYKTFYYCIKLPTLGTDDCV